MVMGRNELALVRHYADREGMSYEAAHIALQEEAACHDRVQDFLDEVGFESDYTWDALQLMQKVQA